MSGFNNCEAESPREGSSRNNEAVDLEEAPASAVDGFGTLGFSPDDPAEFFGSSDTAYIGEDGMLHGVPPFEALASGVVLCPSWANTGCFCVFSASRWDGFVRAMEVSLREAPDEAAGSADREVLTRMEHLVGEPPCRAVVSDGLIPVPEAISGACGIEANESLHVIGNSGYLEVWKKTAFDEMLSSIDLFA